MQNINSHQLAQSIKDWGRALGFNDVGISDIELGEHGDYLQQWLDRGFQGDMDYMSKHGSKRYRPDELVPGTVSVIMVRLDYKTAALNNAKQVLKQDDTAYVSRYALGRDYHKVLRKNLQRLASKIEREIGEFGYRVFTDSAPVMEKALAAKAGLGWIGKHSNLVNKSNGSWFFIGEIYVDLDLPKDTQSNNHCGSCNACVSACPTNAIVGPYQVDARRCISYLTIENQGDIPEHLRSAIGNRIYGCDDCQLACPWNKFAQMAKDEDFTPRAQLTDRKLSELASWSDQEFLDNTEGTAIRRIGANAWRRNIAVAIGNALGQRIGKETGNRKELIAALEQLKTNGNAMVGEHVDWALASRNTEF